MTPPAIVDRYNYTNLETHFADLIHAQSGVEVAGVRITSSGLADLDNDGATDDLYGTALLQVGVRFKPFVFLLREDGAACFFEPSGQRLRPAEEGERMMCMESRSWLCQDTLDRAEVHFSTPRISMVEFDRARAGLELVFHLGRGRLAVVNSLEAFARP